MLDLAQAVRKLENEKEQTQQRLGKLDAALRALGSLGGRFGRAWMQGRKRTISAAARKRIAVAQRARWAKWRAARRNKGKGSRSGSGKD